MIKKSLLFLLIGLLAACTPGVSETAVVPTQTVAATTATTTICTATANSDVTLYSRPDAAAGQFGILAAGEQAQLGGQMASGWLGFDPAVAQAANVGIFRLRWFPPGSDVTLAGDCAALPVYPTISATACYEMALEDVPIYAMPEETAVLLATLPSGSYTALIGKTTGGWYHADLGDGSLAADHSGETGWLAPAAANMNGQTCAELPLVTP
jgi:hypothetical protein